MTSRSNFKHPQYRKFLSPEWDEEPEPQKVHRTENIIHNEWVGDLDSPEWYDNKQKRKRENYIISRVKNLNLESFRILRGSIIPYTGMNFSQNDEKERRFILGIHAEINKKDLSDFGGGISYKEGRDLNVLHGTLRELNEESLGVFGVDHLLKYPRFKISADERNELNARILKYLGDDICVYTDPTNDPSAMLIIFHYMKIDDNQIVDMFNQFNENLKKHDKVETDELVVITSEEFTDSVNGKSVQIYKGRSVKLYERIAKYLHPVIKEIDLLL